MGDPPETSLGALRRRVDELSAKDEIRELHVRYCRGIDRVDFDLVRSTFHHDARIHQPPWFDGTVDGYIELVANSVATGFGTWSHLVTTELIAVDGDRAESEWVLFQIDRTQFGQAVDDFVMTARYLERLERRDGRWAVSERLIVHDVVRVDPVGRTWTANWPAESEAVFGRRKPDDVSYTFVMLAARR